MFKFAKHEAYPWTNENSGKAVLDALSGPEFDKFRAYHDKLDKWEAVLYTADWGESVYMRVKAQKLSIDCIPLDNLVANNKRQMGEFKARMKK
jgi:hypothetical protein